MCVSVSGINGFTKLPQILHSHDRLNRHGNLPVLLGRVENRDFGAANIQPGNQTGCIGKYTGNKTGCLGKYPGNRIHPGNRIQVLQVNIQETKQDV